MNTNLKERDPVGDVMRAIGIVAVVFGHSYQPPFLFFPPYFFQIALFFFVSGYFFKPSVTIKEKILYILKKIKKMLIPFLILNLFFGLLSTALLNIGLRIGTDLNWGSYFITPFGRGDQFELFLTSWFLLNLFIVTIVAGILYQKSQKVNLMIALVVLFIMFWALGQGRLPDQDLWNVFLIRSAFGLGFLTLGYYFKLYEQVIKPWLITPASLAFLYVIVVLLNSLFGNIHYSIMSGDIGNDIVFVPVITSVCIILIVYIFANYLTKALKPNSIIYAIGRHSFAIMVWHMTVFWVINIVLYYLKLIDFENLSNVYFKYEVEKLWLLYQVPAVLVPVYLALGYSKLLKFFRRILLPSQSKVEAPSLITS